MIRGNPNEKDLMNLSKSVDFLNFVRKKHTVGL